MFRSTPICRIYSLPLLARYAASKGAGQSFTRAVAREWGKYGIRVNVVLPAVWTPMIDGYRENLEGESIVGHDAFYEWSGLSWGEVWGCGDWLGSCSCVFWLRMLRAGLRVNWWLLMVGSRWYVSFWAVLVKFDLKSLVVALSRFLICKHWYLGRIRGRTSKLPNSDISGSVMCR